MVLLNTYNVVITKKTAYCFCIRVDACRTVSVCVSREYACICCVHDLVEHVVQLVCVCLESMHVFAVCMISVYV